MIQPRVTHTHRLALWLTLGIMFLFRTGPDAAQVSGPGRDGKPNIAVVNLRNSTGITANESDILSDRLRTEIFNTGKVNVMEREQMMEILKENEFQQSGACSDEECFVEMGKFLGVQLLVVGTIGRLGKLNVINIRLVDVQSARTEMAVSKDIEGGIESIVGHLRYIALQLVEPIAKPKPAPAILGKITVKTDPPDATVRLNGKVAGTSPLAIDSLAPGTYVVSAQKEMHFTSQNRVLIDGNDSKELMIKLAKGAGLNVQIEPAGATVWIGDSAYGTSPFQTMLVPDDISVRATKEGFDDYIEEISLEAGQSKTLSAKLISKFGRLAVVTEPTGATVSVDELSDGCTAPCTVGTLQPGNYTLRCALAGYEPIAETVTVIKDDLVTKTYALVHTQAWNDSVAAARIAREQRLRRGRNRRRIVFGVLSLVSAGAGVLSELQVRNAYAEYNEFRAMNQAVHDENWEKVEQWELLRMISYICAGTFGVGLGISIPF